MKIYNINNYFKFFILFLIFYIGHGHNSKSIVNKNICKQLKDNKYLSSSKNMVYYMCKNNKQRYNTSAVLSKDVLRKYIFVLNIVIIYIIYINI
jgi:uncharacterized membrane protein SpoIIM required for sporulation